MAIIYRQGANDDLVPLASVGIDDDSATGWWGGAQKCFVAVALATFLATAALSTDVAASVAVGEQSDIPAGALVNVKIDDDSATAWWAGAQKCFSWVHASSVQSQTALSAQLSEYEAEGEQSDVPAGSLFGQPDEDFWQNPVAPVPATLFQRLPLGDPEEIPAGSLFGQPDEDFWENPVAPVVASNLWPQPFSFDVQEPAGSLFGQPDEDYWLQDDLPQPVAASLFQRLPYAPDPADSDFVLPPAAFVLDEDFWQNPAAPVPASLYQRLPLGDPEEIPAGKLFGQADEDFWQNPVAPVAASNLWPQPFSFDVQEPAGKLFGQPDEDFWENPVAPVPASLYRSPLLGDQEEIPAGALLKGQPDEDFWANPTRPVAATLFQNLPCLFDSVDFTPTTLPIQDEDFWQNPVAPVAASLYRTPVFRDPEEVPAGSLKKFTSPDEDFWPQALFPAPVPATLFQRLPLGDPEELNAGDEFGQYDEDFWVNPVAPVPASLYRSPVFADPEEVPAGRLVNAKPDEDYWQNRVAPVAASLYQALPYLYDAADSGNLAAAPVTALLGGGIAWPYPELAERHWSAPPSSTLPTKKGKQKPVSIAGTATPAGLSAQAALGTIVGSGSARAKAGGQKAAVTRGSVQVGVAATIEPGSESHRVKRYGVVRLGRVKVRGIRNPSDEDLLWILGEIE
jgi:hypothetical protein